MQAKGEIVFEAFEAKEGGYWARAVGHSIFTQGETWEELEAMAADAVKVHFEEVEDAAWRHRLRPLE